MCQIVPSFPTKTWNEETCICVSVVPIALGDVSNWGPNFTHCTNTLTDTESLQWHLNWIILFPFKQFKQNIQALRHHTSLHCWTWPPSPQRRISNFPDPASPLVQCWHAAGSQLLLEAACESQQRQTHPTSPLPPTTTPPLVFLLRLVVAF